MVFCGQPEWDRKEKDPHPPPRIVTRTPTTYQSGYEDPGGTLLVCGRKQQKVEPIHYYILSLAS